MVTSLASKKESLQAITLAFAIVAISALGLAGCANRPNDDPNRENLPSAKASTKEEFESEFKEIELDMSEQQVDQILAGYFCERRELTENEKEKPPNPYGFDWKLKKKALFVKNYVCKARDNEGRFYIEVYFDDNCSVVGKLLVGNEFLSKCSKIQLDMTEEQVDQILAGYPCKRREVLDIEREQALWPGGKHKGPASFVKEYDCKPGANDGDFYIAVYFDDNYTVVGKVLGEYIS